MYAAREMVAEEGIYGEGRAYVEGEPHRELGVRPRVPRWPRLVRERAVELAPDPDDELWRLGEACAKAYIEADALHYRAMTLLAEFDRREGWLHRGRCPALPGHDAPGRVRPA